MAGITGRTKAELIQALQDNADILFIGDAKRMFYHRKDCEHIPRILKDAMLGLKEGSIPAGFKPCIYCNPAEAVTKTPSPAEEPTENAAIQNNVGDRKAKRKKKGTGGKKPKSKHDVMKDTLTTLAEEYKMHGEFKGNTMNVTTAAGEWYFVFTDRPVKLYHNSYNPESRTYFHQQAVDLNSPVDALAYIRNHDLAMTKALMSEDSQREPAVVTQHTRENRNVSQKRGESRIRESKQRRPSSSRPKTASSQRFGKPERSVRTEHRDSGPARRGRPNRRSNVARIHNGTRQAFVPKFRSTTSVIMPKGSENLVIPRVALLELSGKESKKNGKK